MRPRRVTSLPSTACWTPCTVPLTKGATCSCDGAQPHPAGGGSRRGGRRSPCRQLPAIRSPCPELRRRRARGDPVAAPRAGARPARRAALGVLVRLREPGRSALLARGGVVALHAPVGARVSGHDHDLWSVARAALLVRDARAP